MSKSLSESAAEILSASLSGAGKEPMQAVGAEVQDLGGQTVTTAPTDIGSAAAAKIAVAPKPGQPGAPAEPPKTLGKAEKIADEEEYLKKGPTGAALVKAISGVAVKEESESEEVELTEEELEEYLNSLSEEELEALAAEMETLEEDEEGEEGKVVSEEEETTEEEIAEARKAAMKQLVSDNMGSCKEDIDALFAGEELSEEFRNKATTIFEAAVRARVEAIVETVAQENETILEQTVAQIESQLTEQVDDYMSYVVENWMEENQLAIETGLRAEIAEDFMAGLKNLFVEHYIEVPEDKADLVEELAQQVAKMEESLAEQVEANKNLAAALNESKSKEILQKICEGLTQVQVEKIKALAEGVEFTTEGDYSQKLAVIRENYFPSKKLKGEAPAAIVETHNSGEVSDVMDYYVKAITKQLPK